MTWMAPFLIVLREVLEVALTLVLVVSATRGLPGRSIWISLGILFGIIGSVLIAAFTSVISSWMEGMGQEIFNATVLGLSAFLIGYTVIWMRAHAKKLVIDLKSTSKAVVEGRKHIIALTVLIGLTVWRDGAEIVLLSHGLFATGQNVASLLMGALGGLVVGSLIGFGMYLGMISISARVMFSVLSTLLIFVAAGMVAQSVGFLNAAGVITLLSDPIWDSSHLLHESSFLGELLHVLVGYSSRPTLLQVLLYIGTIGALVAFLKLVDRSVSLRHEAFAR